MYLDKEGNVVPDLSTRGHLAVGVPGTVSGMELALSKYGTKPRKEIIAPAIKLAEDGFVLEQGMSICWTTPPTCSRRTSRIPARSS